MFLLNSQSGDPAGLKAAAAPGPCPRPPCARVSRPASLPEKLCTAPGESQFHPGNSTGLGLGCFSRVWLRFALIFGRSQPLRAPPSPQRVGTLSTEGKHRVLGARWPNYQPKLLNPLFYSHFNPGEYILERRAVTRAEQKPTSKPLAAPGAEAALRRGALPGVSPHRGPGVLHLPTARRRLVGTCHLLAKPQEEKIPGR